MKLLKGVGEFRRTSFLTVDLPFMQSKRATARENCVRVSCSELLFERKRNVNAKLSLCLTKYHAMKMHPALK
jgi:hypothetical protein